MRTRLLAVIFFSLASVNAFAEDCIFNITLSAGGGGFISFNAPSCNDYLNSVSDLVISLTDGNTTWDETHMTTSYSDLYLAGDECGVYFDDGGNGSGDTEIITFTNGTDILAFDEGDLGSMNYHVYDAAGFVRTGTYEACREVPVAYLNNNNGLGDAGLFQYYTVNGGWQTFIRVINTSDQAVSIKVRFREAANSREVLDFIVFLSPYDVWAGWTDDDATGLGNPGVRTLDTSCMFPLPDSNNTDEGFKNLGGNLLGANFQDRAFTNVYDDYGNDHNSSLQRMSEGHLEIIGIASHDPFSHFGLAVTHDPSNGKPANCSQAADLFEEQIRGGHGSDLDNVLAMNGYVINVVLGQGAGYDPDILADFTYRSLVGDALSTATDPDMDSAATNWGAWDNRTKQKGQAGNQDVTGGVDYVSWLLQRSSVMNEWAASANPAAVVSDYYTQWILSFPTKHYYVDIMDDDEPLDDISPTLAGYDPYYAYWPFYEEFMYGENYGMACETYEMRIWNREEEDSEFTSPAPIYPVELCNETNVLVFNEFYLDKGLNSAFSVTIPAELLPVDAGGATSERGWASMDFVSNRNNIRLRDKILSNRWIFDRAGLPVTGWMLSVFNTNDNATNHTTINAHKYTRASFDIY